MRRLVVMARFLSGSVCCQTLTRYLPLWRGDIATWSNRGSLPIFAKTWDLILSVWLSCWSLFHRRFVFVRGSVFGVFAIESSKGCVMIVIWSLYPVSARCEHPPSRIHAANRRKRGFLRWLCFIRHFPHGVIVGDDVYLIVPDVHSHQIHVGGHLLIPLGVEVRQLVLLLALWAPGNQVAKPLLDILCGEDQKSYDLHGDSPFYCCPAASPVKAGKLLGMPRIRLCVVEGSFCFSFDMSFRLEIPQPIISSKISTASKT